MKLLVTVQHPAHVHFYRPVVEAVRGSGHEVSVFAREKDVATDLLDAFGVEYEVLAGNADSLAGLAAVQARWEWRLLRAARRERPDVITGVGGLAAAHVGAALGVPSVVFTDTETPANRLVAPFADAVCTPRQFGRELGSGHRRYDGFQELAYLHPDRFEPDPGALRAAGVDPDDWFAVCRFSGMAAHHDVGRDGLSARARDELAADLAERGSVYASAEGGTRGAGADRDGRLPAGAEPVPVPVHRFHDLLAAADLVVTDAATTAAEAGLLGTPTVRVEAGGDDLGNFAALGRAGLVRSTPDEAAALATARDLADDPGAADAWGRRRDRLVDRVDDVAAFAVDVLVEAGGGRTGPGSERPGSARGQAEPPGGLVESASGRGGPERERADRERGRAEPAGEREVDARG